MGDIIGIIDKCIHDELCNHTDSRSVILKAWAGGKDYGEN